MQKNTCRLFYEALKFVTSHQKITHLLEQRDKDENTEAVSITCSFNQANQSDSNKSLLNVDFIYKTQKLSQNINDDVRVLVEVIEGNPPRFNIVDVKFG